MLLFFFLTSFALKQKILCFLYLNLYTGTSGIGFECQMDTVFKIFNGQRIKNTPPPRMFTWTKNQNFYFLNIVYDVCNIKKKYS